MYSNSVIGIFRLSTRKKRYGSLAPPVPLTKAEKPLKFKSNSIQLRWGGGRGGGTVKKENRLQLFGVVGVVLVAL